MQDYYEILQVHPKADAETIQSAYERLRPRYDPDKLEGAAEELVETARQKRADIDHAYAVLSDEQRRASYDAELASNRASSAATSTSAPAGTAGASAQYPGAEYLLEEDLIDYRPLPPAGKEERPHDFNSQPMLSVEEVLQQQERQRRRPSFWSSPAVVAAVLTFIVGFGSLMLTGGSFMALHPSVDQEAMQQMAGQQGQGQNGQQQMPGAEQLTAQFEQDIVMARQAANAAPENPNAWITLGNTLYDSVQIVREHMPESEAYQEMLPRWVEASEAYSRALALRPDNAVVRSDMAVSLCNYGAGTGEEQYVEQGIQQAKQAFEQGSEEGRVLLNLGTCLVSMQPPQTEEAMKHWRKILVLPEIEQGVVVQAQRMLARYEESEG